MKERRRARSWAIQALYAWEAKGQREEELVPVIQELSETLRISPRNRLYADVLIRIVAQERARIDETIQRNLTNWTLNRLSAIDRNILRLGVAELIFVDDVPQKITIREMMRLAEQYGTAESPRFVNGVLDAIRRELNAGGDVEAR